MSSNALRMHLSRHAWWYATALVSLWLVLTALISDPVINRDGMYYVDQARTLLHGDALQETRWTLFAHVLAGIAAPLQLDPLMVALLLVVLVRVVLALLVYAWLAAANRYVQPGLAFVIAVALPWALAYQAQVLRDSFAWLALVATLVLASAWARDARWRWLVLMAPMIALGVLFRTEMVALLVVPGWLLLAYAWQRGPRVVLALAVVAAAALALLLWLAGEMIRGHLEFYLAALRDNPRFMLFPELVETLSAHVNEYVRSDLGTVIALGLFMLPVREVLDLHGIFLVPLWFGLASAVHRRRALADQGAALVLCLTLFAVLLAFVFAMQFLSGRYVVPMAICLLPWVAQGMQRLWSEWPRSARVFVVVALIGAVTGSLTTTSSKYLLRDLGEYVADHKAELAPVYFTDHRIAFYAQEPYISPATGVLPDEPAALQDYRSLAVYFESSAQDAAPELHALQQRYGFSRVVFLREDDDDFAVALLVR